MSNTSLTIVVVALVLFAIAMVLLAFAAYAGAV